MNILKVIIFWGFCRNYFKAKTSLTYTELELTGVKLYVKLMQFLFYLGIIPIFAVQSTKGSTGNTSLTKQKAHSLMEETKRAENTTQLRAGEPVKIACAIRHFASIFNNEKSLT